MHSVGERDRAYPRLSVGRSPVRVRYALGLLLLVLSCLAACTGSSGEPGRSITAVTDERLLWSPYTWVTEGDARMSPTVGAYVDVSFTGTTIGLEVDTAPLSKKGKGLTHLSVSAIIDGGRPQRITLDKVVDGRLLWDGLEPGTHHVRMTLAKNSSIALRWENARTASLYITGIVTDGPLIAPATAAVEAPTALFYGDSVTEGNGIEDLGVFGDNSFAAVAMTKLGYRYALHAYSALTWQYAPFAIAGKFVSPKSPARGDDITWMNYFQGQSMMTDTSPPRYREGAPDLILNNLGSNDIRVAFESEGYGQASQNYLAPTIEAWLAQVRAAAGPDTVIVMIQPVVYNCPEAYDTNRNEQTRVVRTAYQRGIAAYAAAHPEDKRVLTIDLGHPACKVLLDNKHSNAHAVPKTAEATGDMLATALDQALAKLPE